MWCFSLRVRQLLFLVVTHRKPRRDSQYNHNKTERDPDWHVEHIQHEHFETDEQQDDAQTLR